MAGGGETERLVTWLTHCNKEQSGMKIGKSIGRRGTTLAAAAAAADEGTPVQERR